jgi:hypothetical protein
MSAPVSMPPRRLPVAAQRALWDLTWGRLLSPIEADSPTVDQDTAGSVRPLGAGVRPMQHEAAPAFSGQRRDFEEDGRDDCSTATADT